VPGDVDRCIFGDGTCGHPKSLARSEKRSDLGPDTICVAELLAY
jgi:hypothetical protein